MKILLTGATGFLGARAELFLRQEHDVYALPSALIRGEMAGERAEQLYEAIAAFAPDVLLHTAAISDTAYAEQHPEESRQANVVLPQALARIAMKMNAKLISCSSDQVYNGCACKGPFDENARLSPQNVYGRHKLEAEDRVSQLAPDTVSLRLSWMYDLPAFSLPTHRNLLTDLLAAALQQVPLRLSQSDLRGITYVRHVIANLPRAFTLSGGVYNFGSESAQSVWQIAEAWREALDLDEGFLQPVEGMPRSLCMDCAKIKEEGILLDDACDGIKRCIRDYGLDSLGWSAIIN
ncbi:MAG: sugar nucleotide-binding protein [Eubacteriales bacterium]|nr:sugar nucleotide-binding protein [Eubacteriales bacterium]